ncbi:MAG: flagellar basal body-associated FliL family protein [Pseudohongiella sp.]|nr:flagellar basal body-associated FliL family protein [Pseudohongiella sp.]MDO9519535.1 flagellar basal body-associated FliL family protein [Pseudohongiella sp.]MDP2127457.1 flagellar basal body-associated FliL family protein [Pseudohongiella sp.]
MAEVDEVAVPSANKGKKGLIVIVLAAVLIIAGGGGAWFFLMGSDPANPAPVVAAAPPLGPVQYLDLAPAFIVNFPHQGRQRFLQANVSVMSRDAQAIAAVSQHMPVIRHNLINLLSAQMLLVFEDPAGVETLRQLATQEVKQVLQREIGREGIDEVLFTNFVMQ